MSHGFLVIINNTKYLFLGVRRWLKVCPIHLFNESRFNTSCFYVGQATSLLVRLYIQTKNDEYLKAIRRAVQTLWSSNSTRAYFQNRFVWLEEYPFKSMNKGLFVLNGCLYALIGIIDVYTIDPQDYLFELINEIINKFIF